MCNRHLYLTAVWTILCIAGMAPILAGCIAPESEASGSHMHAEAPGAWEASFDGRNVNRPDEAAAAQWLLDRRNAELATLGQFKVFHAFSFSDRLAESGIGFRHKIVDDGGKRYKMVHYDHGNGLSVADVDGDGRSDIYFTNQVGGNELWRNLGGGTFEDVTEAAGVSLDGQVSVAASFADTDNDGDQDLYVTTVRFGNHLFENDGTGRFKDISAASGLDYKGHSSGAVFFDFDRDGLLDLFLTNVGRYTTDRLVPVEGWTRFDEKPGAYHYYDGIGDGSAFMGHLIPERSEASILYKNAGGNRFVDVSAKTGLLDDGWSGDATTMDVNGDGWLDLYVLNMQGNDQYYENMQGQRFERRTADVFPKTPFGSMGVKVIDYNNDGRMDLYVTDMHADMWEADRPIGRKQEKKEPAPNSIPSADMLGVHPETSLFGNALFASDGNGRFTEVSDATGAETYWPWGVSSGDLNADGYEDLFVTASMNFPYRYAVNSVLLNNRGQRFLNSEFILGVEPRKNGQTAKVWYEIDCTRESYMECGADGAVDRLDVWGSLGSRSSAVFDLDDDGDLDIVTNDFNSEPMVLISDLGQRAPDLNFSKIKLLGTSSNRDGLGARVTLHAGPQRWTKVYDGKSGYLSQSSLPLYFGLGDARQIDRIEVMWPSGRKEVVPGPIPSNRLVVIEEE